MIFIKGGINMKAKKIMSLILAVTVVAGLTVSCANKKETVADGKIVISVGCWPDEEAYP